MPNIHINRDRQSLGHFSPDEVAAGLQSGRFLASDLAWSEGMESWKPLSEFPGLPVVEIETPIIAPGESLLQKPATVEPAWERRQELGFFPAIGESLKDLFGNPGKVFSNLPLASGLGNPLLFMLFVSGAIWAAFLLCNLALGLVGPNMKAGMPGGSFATLILGFALWILLIPALLTLGAFITAAIFHGILMLFGGAKKPFATTFSVVCYAHSVSSLLALIPICGYIFVPFYQAVLCIIGLSKAHQTEGWRATLAVLLPLLLCCGGMILLIGLLATSISQTEVWQEVMKEIEKQSH